MFYLRLRTIVMNRIVMVLDCDATVTACPVIDLPAQVSARKAEAEAAASDFRWWLQRLSLAAPYSCSLAAFKFDRFQPRQKKKSLPERADRFITLI